MRLFIKVQNENYKKIRGWVEENLANRIPPCSDTNLGGLKMSSGSRYTYIRFDVFEENGSYENYSVLDRYMTNLMCDFSKKYLKKLPNSKCWYEYLRTNVANKEVVNSSASVPKFILHHYGKTESVVKGK